MLQRLFDTGRDDVIFRNLCLGLHDWKTKELAKQYLKSSKDVKEKMLKDQSNRLSWSRGWTKYQDKDWRVIVLESLVDAIHNGELSTRQRDSIFGHRDDENLLLGPLGELLRKKAKCDMVLDTHNKKNLPCGNPDFITIRKHKLSKWPHVFAVDAKANNMALDDFYRQCFNYYERFDRVYLATTGWVAAERGSKFKEELDHWKAGLIYIDVTSPKLSSIKSKSQGHCRNEETKKRILKAVGYE